MKIRSQLLFGCQFLWNDLDKNANHANITKTSFLLCHFLCKFRVNQEITTNISLGNFAYCEQSQGSNGVQPSLQYFHCKWIFWQFSVRHAPKYTQFSFPLHQLICYKHLECLGIRNHSKTVTNELVLVSMWKDDILSTAISQKMPT